MRQQTIKNTGTGAAYVTHNGKRLPLEKFERTKSEVMTALMVINTDKVTRFNFFFRETHI